MSERDPLSVCGETLAQKYEIRELVASGGFSLVYQGWHKLWKAPIAVKFFTFLAEAPAEDRAALQEAFVNEGALLSELSSQSASIVQPRDVGTYTTAAGDWIPYMVMEWLDGQPLDLVMDQENYRKEPRRTPAEVYLLLDGVARALELAHQRGVAHRDVKPENLVVMGDPRTPDVVKLLDFGVAQIMDVQGVKLGTTGHQVSSYTPSYGAPEQFDGRFGTTGPWTDVFQLALIATELISGRQALSGPSAEEFAASSTNPRVRPTPAQLGGFVSPDVEAVFEQALALYPADRFPTAGQFWSALADALGIIQSPSVRPPPISEGSVRAMTPPETRAGGSRGPVPAKPRGNEAMDSSPDLSFLTSGGAASLEASVRSLPEAPKLGSSPFAGLGPLSGGGPLSREDAGTESAAQGFAAEGPLGDPQVGPESARASAPPAPSSSPVARPLGPSEGRSVGWLGTAGVAGFAALGAGALVFWLKSAPDAASARTANGAVVVAASPALPVPEPCPPGMQRVEAGQFFRGSDAEDAPPDEKPSHQVILAGFCLDVTEVTVKDYTRCSSSGKCRRAATEVNWEGITRPQSRIYSTVCNQKQEGRDDHPINCVSWLQARDYCQVQGKRLPTEAEWEYAARSADGRTYPWGEDEPSAKQLNACGWECVNWGTRQGEKLTSLYEQNDRFPTTAPVGSFPAGDSRFGIKDLLGNVSEWVSDWKGDYISVEQKNPAGPSAGEEKVIRGGAWDGGNKAWIRPSFRSSMKPESVSHAIGFRCAKALPGQAN